MDLTKTFIYTHQLPVVCLLLDNFDSACEKDNLKLMQGVNLSPDVVSVH